MLIWFCKTAGEIAIREMSSANEGFPDLIERTQAIDILLWSLLLVMSLSQHILNRRVLIIHHLDERQGLHVRVVMSNLANE